MKISISISIIIIAFLTITQLVTATRLSDAQVMSIAEAEFEKTVPVEYKKEYQFNSVNNATGNPAIQVFVWQRYVNGFPVMGEGVLIAVDSEDGSIFNKRFERVYNSSDIDTTYAMTNWQAAELATNAYKRQIAKQPELVVYGDSLIWLMTLSFDSKEYGDGWVEIGVNANTGESEVLGVSQGTSIEQIPTSFTPPWYQPILLHPEYAIILIMTAASVSIYLIKTKKIQIKR